MNAFWLCVGGGVVTGGGAVVVTGGGAVVVTGGGAVVVTGGAVVGVLLAALSLPPPDLTERSHQSR